MKEEYEGVGERKTHAVITFLEPKFPYIQFLYKQVLLYVCCKANLLMLNFDSTYIMDPNLKKFLSFGG